MLFLRYIIYGRRGAQWLDPSVNKLYILNIVYHIACGFTALLYFNLTQLSLRDK